MNTQAARDRIGERVRMAMARADLSQVELAEKLREQGIDVFRGTVQRLAKGESVRDSGIILGAIAQLTGFSFDFMFGAEMPWDDALILASTTDKGASLDWDSDLPLSERLSLLPGRLHSLDTDPITDDWNQVDPEFTITDGYFERPTGEHTQIVVRLEPPPEVDPNQTELRLNLKPANHRYGRREEDRAS